MIEAVGADLAERVRAGDEQAVAEVFLRHHSAMLAYAQALCRDRHTAEDLASEAFTRTLQAVRRGGGPDGAWRPYLYAAVRNLAADWARAQRRAVPSDDIADLAESAGRPADTGTGPDEHAARAEDRSLISAAFRALPVREQTVLWHTIVEEEPRAQVAAALGTTQNHLNVLVFRARESLREAYLALHAATTCAGYAKLLARAVRRQRDSRRLRAHLDDCAHCRAVYAELIDLDRYLRAALLPAVLLPALVGKSGAAVTGAVAAKAGLLHKLVSLPGAAVAGTAGVALVTVPIVIALNGPDGPAPRHDPPAAATAQPDPSQTRRPRPPGATGDVMAEPIRGQTAITTPAPSTPPARTAPKPRPTAGATDAQRRAIQDGRSMIAAANRGRTANGVPPLRTDDRLNRAAADQALEMARTGTVQAQTQTMATRYGYPTWSGAYSSGGIDPVAAATRWFGPQAPAGSVARSPDTRAIGAACARGAQGATWCSLLVGRT
ncbi:sigma-70 family RNA polymerase sigma factor [Actinomadura rayongensis]|uniref:Sigma-70 family RNA polymerase sigma factor n=1 Tax=Actinomadura rayongensis TaxID=1429076 RepID=A0A6I4W802_9ACTN|nr:sigma-70 family RNA polymerase sigma factor [Actinomadura rayongensis]MXQ65758.1 sigma-70 family RNA polymerase sigma factor [Actinomadura rayongensis]